MDNRAMIKVFLERTYIEAFVCEAVVLDERQGKRCTQNCCCCRCVQEKEHGCTIVFSLVRIANPEILWDLIVPTRATATVVLKPQRGPASLARPHKTSRSRLRFLLECEKKNRDATAPALSVICDAVRFVKSI
eukprot:scaffold13527_cov202-Amphora_coffeaeformis.AAC.10